VRFLLQKLLNLFGEDGRVNGLRDVRVEASGER
jgi:hypothetical protein